MWFRLTEANCETVPQRKAGDVPFISEAPIPGSQLLVNCEFHDLKFPMPLQSSLKKESSSEVSKSQLVSQFLLGFETIQKLCKYGNEV